MSRHLRDRGNAGSGGPYRESRVDRLRRRFPLDLLGSAIFLGLGLVGALVVDSAEGPGETGVGVALVCAAVFLLAEEIHFAIHPHTPATRTRGAARDGESDD